MLTHAFIAAILAQSAPAAAPAAAQEPAAPKGAAPAAPAAPVTVSGRIPDSASPACDAAGAPGIAMLVAADARPDLIINGLQFAEGPTSDAQGQTYFCDMSGSRIYRIVRTATGIRADVVADGTLSTSGLAWSRDGRLFGTQFSGGKVVEVVLAADGTGTLRSIVPALDVKPMTGANDLVTDGAGGIWFSNMGDPRRSELRGVFYTTDTGTEPVRFDVPAIKAPNGIRLSPDGRTLYVVDYKLPQVWAFPVEGPAKLGEGRPFASLSVVGDPKQVLGGDGLAVDVLGNVWVAVPRASAIVVFDPQGKPLGRIMLPNYPSNCAFGGPDGRSLYITARDGIYVLPTLVQGHWTAKGGAPPVKAAAPAAAPASIAAPAVEPTR